PPLSCLSSAVFSVVFRALRALHSFPTRRSSDLVPSCSSMACFFGFNCACLLNQCCMISDMLSPPYMMYQCNYLFYIKQKFFDDDVYLWKMWKLFEIGLELYLKGIATFLCLIG